MSDPDSSPRILLDAYAARSCPVKTQNAFDPTIPAYPVDATSNLQEIFAGVQPFKDEVLNRLASAEGALDLRGREDRREATVEAMGQGVPVIVGAALPHDVAGHRRGSPDALVRGQDQADGRPGYHPVQVKKKRMMEARKPKETFCWVTPLERPLRAEIIPLEEHSVRINRDAELIQLAHYVRTLQSLGWAADREVAGVIPSDALDALDGDIGLVFVDLRHRFIRTFSRTAETHWKLRSALERYDHEFGFRVKVAQTATTHVAGEPWAPRVSPIVVRECESCPWWQHCEPALDDDDLSLRISKSPLDVREISVLRKLGVSTLADLADADLDALLPAYLPEAAHRPNAESRLRTAARRSRLIRDGVVLSKYSDDPIELPGADIEVDLDIETSGDGSVYLWGLLVDDTTTDEPPTYHAFVRWHELGTREQVDLAREAMQFIESLRATGKSVRVYHYSDYEIVHLNKIAAQQPEGITTALHREQRLVGESWVDLYSTVKDHFFGVHGLGLKVVASHGAGFHWRDDEPGGLNSQTWFRDAADPELEEDLRGAARERVLAYNEDDVVATHQLRRWLRAEYQAGEKRRAGDAETDRRPRR